MNFIAIDIGSGLTKCSTGDKKNFYFESLVGVHSDHGDFSYNVEGHLVIHTQGKQFLTGAAAKSYIEPEKRSVTTKSTWCEDKAQTILLYSAIAKAFPDGLEGELVVVCGLPMARFSKHKDSHAKMFIGEHQFTTPSQSYQFSISESNIAVLPQSIGLHFSNLAISKEGSWNKGRVGYIDPGTHTCGYACVDNGVFINLKSADPKSAGGESGLVKLAKAMKPELKEQYDWVPENSELLDALRVGHVEFMGEKPQRVELKAIAARYVPKVYGAVVNEIVEKWEKARTMRVVISSGGGEYLIEYVRRFIPHAQLLQKKRTAKDSINESALFDVVNGYSIYGTTKFKINVKNIDDVRQKVS